MTLVAAGRTNGQIARRLRISEGTVRTHLENIFERLRVTNRAAASSGPFRTRTPNPTRRPRPVDGSGTPGLDGPHRLK